MATQVRSKPASKAPVTKHPLFPAMVALWFGALFGLGSLAVRASLLESLVLSLSLDVLLPAAAPPLGLKARLILALLLAAIGVALGATLARRIARPKPVQTQRRRDVSARAAARQAIAEGAEAASPRRRPLTIEPDEEPAYHYDAAPLPGGSPAILDVTQIDLSTEPYGARDEAPLALDTFVADAPVHAVAEAEPATEYAPAMEAEPAAAPLAPDAFAAGEAEPPASNSCQAFAEVVLDAGYHSPTPSPERQMFRAAGPEPESPAFAPPAEAPPAPLNFHPPAGAPIRVEEEFEDELVEEFGAEVTEDVAAEAEEAPLDLLAEHEIMAAEAEDQRGMIETGSAFESPAAPAATPAAFEPAAAASEIACESADEAGTDAEPQPLPVVPPVLLAQPLPESPPVPQPAPPSAPFWAEGESQSSAKAVSRIETAQLAELSPVELIERLAIAMRQRAHQGPMPEALADAVSSLVAAAPADVAPEAACAESTVAEELPAFDPAPIIAPFAAAVDAQPAASEAPESEPVAAAAAPARLALPAALRPIDFSDYGDHDDSADLALPPRSFAAPKPAEPEAVLELSSPLAEEAEADDVLEEGYSSLLELGRSAAPRQDFVRIEEPEDDSAQIEPVVIFPGHGARPGTRFAAPDAAAQAAQAPAPAAPVQTESGTVQLRRFDAPAAVAAPSAPAQAGGLRQDPDEAQRALRSALATLQRMSGAA